MNTLIFTKDLRFHLRSDLKYFAFEKKCGLEIRLNDLINYLERSEI